MEKSGCIDNLHRTFLPLAGSVSASCIGSQTLMLMGCSRIHRDRVLKGEILELTVLRPGCQNYLEKTFNHLHVSVWVCRDDANSLIYLKTHI